MKQYGKQTKLLAEYIAKIAQGKHAMIIGAEYVVLSRNIYDEMIKKYERYESRSPLDCINDGIDLDKEQDMIYEEIEERQRRDFPKGR